MGVEGLMTYIKGGDYTEPFELDNTSLVIDGCNLSSYLYDTCTNCHYLLGGDYDQFFHTVFQFFSDLLQCKVTPLVILDGGWEKKKWKTVIKRYKKRIECASGISHATSILNPLFLGDVFVDVLNKLKIRYVMCVFEADSIASSIAKILNVPVLSNDSDFFISGADFIPCYTVESRVCRYARGYVKKCRIYRVEKLLEKFKGLNIDVLPLVSILLGNDYVDRSIFDAFSSHIKITNVTKQQRIEATFDWLKNHSLNTAIAVISKCLPYEQRKDILRLIEIILNDFSRPSIIMLSLFVIDEQSISEQLNNFTPFKFQDNLNNLEYVDNYIDDNDNIQSEYQKFCENNEVDCRNFEDENENDSLEEWNEEKFVDLLPQWFVNDHLAGKFPSYFVNILTNRIYKAPVQYEDFSYGSAEMLSFSILIKVCSLLITRADSSVNNTNTDIKLLIREGDEISYQRLSVPLSSVPLDHIRNFNEAERKKIIDDALQISEDDKLDELPLSWQLYTAAILYWMRQNNHIELTNVHLDALLMSMLIGILDRTVGFNRPQNINLTHLRRQLNNTFNDEINKMKYQKLIGDDKSMFMVNLINSITKEDCTGALPFFLEHSNLNNKRLRFGTHVDNIVHAYAQFQSCLSHAMALNALMGDIYIRPSPVELFNGTLIYNMYSDFSTQSDVDTYIATRLKDSPVLLKIFKKLHEVMIDALKN